MTTLEQAFGPQTFSNSLVLLLSLPLTRFFVDWLQEDYTGEEHVLCVCLAEIRGD
jgi:hypothetical protein